MVSSLEGKVAFITGAARGQGRHNAVRLAREGAHIIGIDICRPIASVHYALADPADLEETASLVATEGRDMLARQVDVRDFDAMERCVSDGVQRFGRLDIVNANAGISTLGSVLELAPSAWQDVIDVNLTGAWNTAKVAIPHLIEGGRGGVVVLTDSVAGLVGRANASAYVAAKHGLVGLMRALALELAAHNIRVNCLHPTQVPTPMIMNDMTMSRFVPGASNVSVEEFAAVSQTLHALPVPWVQPSDIAAALAFLASDEARYITGVSLPIDAGALLL